MALPSTPSFRLEGKTALVAGASSGIGRASAVALAEAGAHVILSARRDEKLQETVAEITAMGWSAKAMALDLTDIDTTAKSISQLERLDVFVNSVGGAKHGPALDTRERDFDLVADLNWKAAHFSAREAARKMIAGKAGGSIITISSQMGHVGGVDRSVYAASKHAIEGMTKSMAIEWGSFGVRVNSICPTFIRTALTAETFANSERRAWIESKIKLGRVGEVEDIMGATVFLASEASALITGTSIVVDGGWTAG